MARDGPTTLKRQGRVGYVAAKVHNLVNSKHENLELEKISKSQESFKENTLESRTSEYYGGDILTASIGIMISVHG